MMLLPLGVRFLSKTRKTRKVLDRVSFNIYNGDVCALIGLNGAGKTTLLKSILQLCRSDGGVVEFFGINAMLTKSRARVMYLPEKFAISPAVTGKEVLHFYRASKDNVERYSDIFSLDSATLGRRTGEYSKGMQQILALILAFSVDADLLILDEPISGLDFLACRNLQYAVQQAVLVHGKTIFFTSHALTSLKGLCNRVLVLHHGSVVEKDPLYADLEAELMSVVDAKQEL